MTYETLTGEEIENIINKNFYPSDKQDLKVEDDQRVQLWVHWVLNQNSSLILMNRYYTRACNFYFGSIQRKK